MIINLARFPKRKELTAVQLVEVLAAHKIILFDANGETVVFRVTDTDVDICIGHLPESEILG